MTEVVVIMAAGRGTRMGELTADRPKHLLPVLGRPFLEHTFDRLRAAGFREIIIITGHKNHVFTPYEQVPGIRLVEQQQLHHRYGTAAAVETAKGLIGDRAFSVIAGDNLYSVNDLRKTTIDSSHLWLGGFRTAAWKGMGVLMLNPDGYLDRIVEKPDTFVGDLANASIYLFTPKIFQAIESIGPSPRGEYELTDAINEVAKHEPVNVFELEERWLDLTAPSDIPKIEKALSEGTI